MINGDGGIRKIILNRASFNEYEFEPKYINLIYGKNGTGKSTIANAISDRDSIIINNDINQYQYLVFNKKFVDDNLSDYGNINGVFTLGETNISINRQIENNNNTRKRMGERYSEIVDIIDNKNSAKKALFDESKEKCWQNTKTLRKTFSEAMKGFRTKDKFFSELLNKTPKDVDIVNLKSIYEITFSTDTEIYDRLIKPEMPMSLDLPGAKLMDKPIYSSKNTEFSKFIEAIEAADWVYYGHKHYSEKSLNCCPFCQQILPENFYQKIADSYDDKFNAELERLKEFKNAYYHEVDGIFKALSSNIHIIKQGYDFNDYISILSFFENAIQYNKKIIEDKLNNPSKAFVLKSTKDILIQLYGIINDYNSHINLHNSVVKNMVVNKEKCTTDIWHHFAYILLTDINEYKNRIKKIDMEIENLNKEKENLIVSAKELKKQVNELLKKTVSTYTAVNNINDALSKVDFQGFTIRARANNQYEIIRANDEIADNLSDGERYFIGFLYFCQLIMGTMDGGVVKDKIVVIDDPVNNMDCDCVEAVADILNDMISQCQYSILGNDNSVRQLYILTHSLDLFNNIVDYQTSKNNSISVYELVKDNNISQIYLKVDYNNDASQSELSLWNELKNSNSASHIVNIIEQIIDLYFVKRNSFLIKDIEKIVLEDNSYVFKDTEKNIAVANELYRIVKEILYYMENGILMSRNIEEYDKTSDPKKYAKALFIIFKAMGHEKYYYSMIK